MVATWVTHTYDEHEEKTQGIVITPWSITIPDNATVRLHLWDFGGQEIMHATHQFFLTKRTLYILVLDAHLGEAENRLDYWLQIISSFSDQSPIIIVGNKIDQHPLDLDTKSWISKYPNIKKIIPVSCKNSAGLDVLQTTITEEIATLEHIHDAIPVSWFAIKSALEAHQAPYLSYVEYQQICIAHNIDDERNQRILLRFLHDLGIVLHFPYPRLDATNILNPEWVTKGIYQIINSRALFENHGVLDWAMLAQELDGQQYPPEKQAFIMDMMCEFQLSYRFDDSSKEQFLVPDLLAKESPYVGDWENALNFQYCYTILPGNVMSRFIVRMHQQIHEGTVWRYGILLKSQDNLSLVKADPFASQISIQIKGPEQHRRAFLWAIRAEFDKIHKSIPGLKIEEKVPIPGHLDVVVDYQHLLNLESMKKPIFIPTGLKEEFNVQALLDGIDPEEVRQANRQLASTDEENTRRSPTKTPAQSWFYLIAVVVILILLTAIGLYTPWYVFLGVLMGTVLLLVVIGVLTLAAQDKLDDASFVTIMQAALESLGLFNLFEAINTQLQNPLAEKSKRSKQK